jgi:hypothetical protein
MSVKRGQKIFNRWPASGRFGPAKGQIYGCGGAPVVFAFSPVKIAQATIQGVSPYSQSKHYSKEDVPGTQGESARDMRGSPCAGCPTSR